MFLWFSFFSFVFRFLGSSRMSMHRLGAMNVPWRGDPSGYFSRKIICHPLWIALLRSVGMFDSIITSFVLAYRYQWVSISSIENRLGSFFKQSVLSFIFHPDSQPPLANSQPHTQGFRLLPRIPRIWKWIEGFPIVCRDTSSAAASSSCLSPRSFRISSKRFFTVRLLSMESQLSISLL